MNQSASRRPPRPGPKECPIEGSEGSPSRWAWGYGSTLLLALAFVLPGCERFGLGESEESVEPEEVVVPVRVAHPWVETIERTIAVVGTLNGFERVTLSAEQPGRVSEVLCEAGDVISPGAVLVALDPIDAKLAVRQAERQLEVSLARLGLNLDGSRFPLSSETRADEPDVAGSSGDLGSASESLADDLAIRLDRLDLDTLPSIVQARADRDRANQALSRERALQVRAAGRLEDYQNAQNDQRSAVAGLDQAILQARSDLASARASQAALAIARRNLAQMQIIAPIPRMIPPIPASRIGASASTIAGPDTTLRDVRYAVAARQVAEGQFVARGDPVVDLVITDPLRLRSRVPERYVDRVRVGQMVQIHVAAYEDQLFNGQITRMTPQVDPLSRTFEVEVLVPNPDGLLRPGGFAKAEIVLQQRAETLVVPTDALVREAGLSKLFVIERERSRAIAVRIGQVGQNPKRGGWIEVVIDDPDGGDRLTAESQVVVTGQTRLANQTRVQVLDEWTNNGQAPDLNDAFERSVDQATARRDVDGSEAETAQ